jgi:alcohol dehydrogenase
MNKFEEARILIRRFKGETYLSGFEVLPEVGRRCSELGERAVIVCNTFPGSEKFAAQISESLEKAGVQLLAMIPGARPNAPREDVFRIEEELRRHDPNVIVSFGGGSTIDAAKAAEALRTSGGSIDGYFGTGLVSKALGESGKKLTPHVAIQTAASSAAHLTKYSNITDLATGQKKLIVDAAIVPARPVFDYGVTLGAPASLTADGAVDGLSHILEVYFSEMGKPNESLMEEISRCGIALILEYLPRVLENPADPGGREALALATDLGGYAIMIGGTNGAHLTSFSMVDILSHGRACFLMNPYYAVFFAPAVEPGLKLVGRMCRDLGYTGADIEKLSGSALGIAVAEALIKFGKRVGMPTTLSEVPGFSDSHIARALAAAKTPQLKMKLENMPVPLTAEMVDDYMGPVLEAARTGNLGLIRNVPRSAHS